MPQDTRYTARDVKIGVLVTVSVVFLIVLIAITSDMGRYFRPKKVVRVAFKHVVGLQPNSPVNYSGVETGRVKHITVTSVTDKMLEDLVFIGPEMLFELPIEDNATLDRLRGLKERADFNREARAIISGRDMVLLEIEVDARTMEVIHEDDYVSVESTLMGDTSVEISPGAGAPVKADAILIGRAGSLFTRIGDSVEEIRYLLRSAGAALSAGGADFGGIFRKVDTAAGNFAKASDDLVQLSGMLNKVLTATKDDLVVLTKNTKNVSQRMDNILARVERDVDPITGNVSASVSKMREVIDTVAPHVDPLVTSARTLSERMESLTGSAGKLVDVTNEMVEESRADLRRTTQNVKDATRNVTEFTALVSQKPWLLLRAPRGEDRSEQDLLTMARMLLDGATRAHEAAMRLTTKPAATDAEKAELARTAADLKDTSDSLRRAAEAMVDVLRPLDRKNGGKGFEKERSPAPEYPMLER